MIHIFILNPYAGNKNFTTELRERIAEVEGLQYYILNTRYAGYEKEVVAWIQDIFRGEELRFYCCGGSGTVRNMLCGFDNLENTQVAICPCGLTNDFLKVFGNDQSRFTDIKELIFGDVIDVDYIDTNAGRALNTFSLGIDSISQTKIQDFKILNSLSNQLPYVLSILYAIFSAKEHAYELIVDGQKLEGEWTELFFGNGSVLGGSCRFVEEANVTDGKGKMVLMSSKIPLQMIKYLIELTSGNFDAIKKHSLQMEWEDFTIRRKDGKPFTMNFDGELVHGLNEWHARIVHKGLHLVVPKGVRL